MLTSTRVLTATTAMMGLPNSVTARTFHMPTCPSSEPSQPLSPSNVDQTMFPCAESIAYSFPEAEKATTSCWKPNWSRYRVSFVKGAEDNA